MGTIRITPEELRSAVEFLGQRLESLNTEVGQLKSKIDEVEAGWEGAAQSAFMESFQNDMYPILSETLPQVIEGIQSQLSGAADTLEQADLEISNAFKG
jgi:WXG100 family type VII secretion target